MPPPDDLDLDAWVCERVYMSVAMERALGVATSFEKAPRYAALEALAPQLRIGIDTSTAPYASLLVLDLLREQLEEVLTQRPGDWMSDVEQKRPHRIAEKAAEPLDLDLAVEALIQFGWGRFPGQLKLSHASQVHDAVRGQLVERLADRLVKLLNEWRNKRVWDRQERPIYLHRRQDAG